MANKAKLINLAQKAMARGQWDKAVSLLEKVLADDPSDVRTRLKLGDVHAKKGDRQQACDVYRAVAEAHAEQGFFLKAVAVYKQILKIDAHQPEAALRIAELHEQLGLTQDAMAHFQVAVPLLESKGMDDKVVEVLERIADLDPENIAARIKLAETLSRDGQRSKAVVHFSAAASVLKQQARMEDYIKVAERLIFHDSSRLEVVKDLAQLYLGRGDTKRGLAKLQICFQEDPKDVETLTLLAKAFSDLGQVQKTVFVYRELARLYIDHGRAAEAEEIHRLILQHQPDDPEALRALGREEAVGHHEEFDRSTTGSLNVGFVPEPPPAQRTGALPIDGSQDLRDFVQPRPPSEPPPAQPPPISSPSSVPTPQADLPRSSAIPTSRATDDVERIVREAEVYIRYNLPGKAIEHLHKAFQLNRESLMVYQRLYDVYLSMNDMRRAAESLANVARLYGEQGETELAEEARIELIGLSPEHPFLHGQPTTPADEFAVPGESVSVDIAGEESADLSDLISVDPGAEDIELDTGEVEVSAGSGLSEAPWASLNPHFDDVEPTDESVAAESTNPSAAKALGAATPPMWEPPADTSDDLISDSAQIEASQSKDDWEPISDFNAVGFADSEDGDPSDLSLVVAALAAGQNPLPSDVIEGLSEETPSDSEILLLTEQIEESRGVTPAPRGPEPDDLEEVRFFIEAKLYDEALGALSNLEASFPGHPELLRLRSMADISGDIATPELPSDAIDLFDSKTERAPLDTSPSERASKSRADELYDQGMAYKQIGQLEQAARHFQEAAESGGHRASDAFEMLGRCWMDLGRHRDAVEAMQKALEFTDDTEVGINLRYELGATLQEMGDLSRAQAWFEACQALSPEHRDVETRVQNLRDITASGPKSVLSR